ncbi:hypothetical protein [Bathymodiolus japonicus methanotrophic gill symbiont]|uniref:hypothetical protein n=1 Tax=Bathymodiolus japonicus methanotrophic gill symbiont TaxID=113269 RepID=UPI001C8E5E49|nr:hypothetical protein [Bathymodiolus japonicus methanotrophic gill symbiont]
MERKSKVTQSAANAACEQLQADSKNVTVNAVIGITGDYRYFNDVVRMFFSSMVFYPFVA